MQAYPVYLQKQIQLFIYLQKQPIRSSSEIYPSICETTPYLLVKTNVSYHLSNKSNFPQLDLYLSANNHLQEKACICPFIYLSANISIICIHKLYHSKYDLSIKVLSTHLLNVSIYLLFPHISAKLSILPLIYMQKVSIQPFTCTIQICKSIHKQIHLSANAFIHSVTCKKKLFLSIFIFLIQKSIDPTQYLSVFNH